MSTTQGWRDALSETERAELQTMSEALRQGRARVDVVRADINRMRQRALKRLQREVMANG